MFMQHIGKTCPTKPFKYTYIYNSLHFPAEINTRGSKTPQFVFLYQTNYDYMRQIIG